MAFFQTYYSRYDAVTDLTAKGYEESETGDYVKGMTIAAIVPIRGVEEVRVHFRPNVRTTHFAR